MVINSLLKLEKGGKAILFYNEVRKLPVNPGVYQFLNKDDTIIYVGKAKNLRKRVSSYFFIKS